MEFVNIMERRDDAQKQKRWWNASAELHFFNLCS